MLYYNPSHAFWESSIIKTRLLVSEKQHTLYYIQTEKLNCDCETKVELYLFCFIYLFFAIYVLKQWS